MASFLKAALLVVCLMQTEGSELSRIVGGSDVIIADHPWQISLRRSGSHICGGSFIGNQWVITAAHCVDGQAVSALSIGYGDSSLSYHNFVGVASVIVHPDYLNNGDLGYPHDFALLRLSQPVEFDSFTNMIGLASNTNPLTDCTITGWGCTSAILGICLSSPETLKGAPIEKINPTACKSLWSDQQIQDMHVCVYESGKSACMGDSGGPLTCYQDGVKVLAGVTSWGSSSCNGNTPSVYARISWAYTWIMSVIGQ